MKRDIPDMVNIILGIWLAVSPFFLKFIQATSAAGNAFLIGAVVGFIAMMALAMHHRWEEWVNLLFGLWLIISPWVLGFTTHVLATWNIVIVGALLLMFSLWGMVEAYHRPPAGRGMA